MTDDAIPTPPPQRDAQGLPARGMPFSMIPATFDLRRCDPLDGQDPVVAMIYDSPDARVVSYWTEAALLKWADTIRGFVGAPVLERFTPEDLRDLGKLHDAKPFEGTP